jgi:6-pyruvoyltetrahydropterin/6-carboxytetrahydropterin synthase
VEKNIDELVAHYQDKTLNELPEFKCLNPSIEHFSRIICQALLNRITAPDVSAIRVTIKENQIASASYRQEL